MAHNGDLVEVVHARPTDMPVRDRKPGRFDDMGFDVEARTQTENCPGVLRYIRLEERDPHELNAFRDGFAAMGGFVHCTSDG